jgi:WD40 repeat protein
LAVLNENTLISGSWDKTIKIWNITNGSVINTLKGHEGYIEYIVLLNQDLLASACGTGTRIDDPSIHIWNLKTGEINLSLVGYGPLATFSSASSSINEFYLIASSTDKTIQIWNYSNGNLIKTLDGHKYGMGAIAVLSESLIATASVNEIRIWNVDNEFSIKTMKTAENDDVSINSLIVLKNGLLVSCGYFSFKINVWNTTSGSLVHTLEEHSQVRSRTMGVIALDVLENGSLVSGASDYLIKIWNEIP